jgi:hypothetical protein
MRVASGGGGGKRKGRKVVGFEQGTLVDGKCAAMKKGLSSQVSSFPFFNQ